MHLCLVQQYVRDSIGHWTVTTLPRSAYRFSDRYIAQRIPCIGWWCLCSTLPRRTGSIKVKEPWAPEIHPTTPSYLSLLALLEELVLHAPAGPTAPGEVVVVEYSLGSTAAKKNNNSGIGELILMPAKRAVDCTWCLGVKLVGMQTT